MDNPTMNEEYLDDKQRYAVCKGEWGKGNKSKRIKDPKISLTVPKNLRTDNFE
jgi:hypothetical protein